MASERRWFVNELSAKHDFLNTGLGWGHMPADLVADDITSGALIELDRHAWHIGSLRFMVSRLRGHQPSIYETQLIDLLTHAHAVESKT